MGSKSTGAPIQGIMLRKAMSSPVITPWRAGPGRHQALCTLYQSSPILAEQALLMKATWSYTSKYRVTRNPKCHVVCPNEIINSHYFRCLSRLMDKTMLSYRTLKKPICFFRSSMYQSYTRNQHFNHN